MGIVDGKVAIVTGGTRGIGYVIVKEFLKNGAKVALAGSRQETADQALAKLAEEGFADNVMGIAPTLTDPEAVAAIIHSLGFFRSKAKNLVALAQTVMADFGGEIPADVDALQKLPGVGRKTANCVMCEAFKDPQGIAVDTHVFRIAHRLKLAGPSADTPQKVEDILLKVYPRPQWLFINHQWVHFGREFCRARNPRCADCIVGDLCPTRGLWS